MERKRILGFPIHSKKGRLYAVKRIRKKVHWVTLGENLQGAEDKIKAYCYKKQINLETIKTSNNKKENLTEIIKYIKFLEQRLENLEKSNRELRERIEQLEWKKELVADIVDKREDTKVISKKAIQKEDPKDKSKNWENLKQRIQKSTRKIRK